ncbi:MAG: integrase arm-type DNA-binding domain-containing protein [Desulfovibrio sp.]|nr:integrase arm-type DNA-binding domain-containing protein [Desulfovibrio sp.]
MAGSLSDKKIKALVPKEKTYIQSDGDGMYLEVTPKGSKRWRMKYRFWGKENRLSLGLYPQVSLAQAREKCQEARKLIAEGIDPSQARKKAKAQAREEEFKDALTYADVVKKWFEVKQLKNVERTQKVNRQRLDRHILPALGGKLFCEVTQEDQLAILRDLENRDVLEECKRVCDLMEQIGAYAQARKWSEGNIALGLKQLIKRRPSAKKTHLPAITELEGVRAMLKKIDVFCKRGEQYGNPSSIMRAALRLYPLTGLRGNELAAARWEEVNFEERKMVIPLERCQKTKMPFTVYLSSQAVAILQDLYEQRRNGFIFRSGGKNGYITLNGVNNALHSAGIPKGEMCNHGWRSVMLTLGHQYCPDYEAVELSASHQIGNDMALANNRGTYEERRRAFIQWWSDFLDALANDREPVKYHIEY